MANGVTNAERKDSVVAGTGMSVSTSGNTTTVGLASSGVTAGTYGSATAIPKITVDSTGRVTSVSTNTVSASVGSSGVTAGTYGSSTVIPQITVGSDGRVTKVTNVTVYPPTSAGTSGQVWTSDGNGAGYWSTISTASPVSELSYSNTSKSKSESTIYLTDDEVNAKIRTGYTLTWLANSSAIGSKSGTVSIVETLSIVTSDNSTVTKTRSGSGIISNSVLLSGSTTVYLQNNTVTVGSDTLSYGLNATVTNVQIGLSV